MKCCAVFFAFTLSAIAQGTPRSKGPLVYINGNGATYVSQGTVAKHDETMEMARDLIKFCPEVTVTVKDSDPAPDYVLALNRGEEHMGAAISQIMLLRGSDKVVLWSDKQGTVAKAVKAGCHALQEDWRRGSGDWWQNQKKGSKP